MRAGARRQPPHGGAMARGHKQSMNSCPANIERHKVGVGQKLREAVDQEGGSSGCARHGAPHGYARVDVHGGKERLREAVAAF